MTEVFDGVAQHLQWFKAVDIKVEIKMAADNRKPWNTPDFELRFREAMGRDMTDKEREFFGIDDSDSSSDDPPEGRGNSDSAKFAWQALRRISALMG
jgi:hypothetical protein